MPIGDHPFDGILIMISARFEIWELMVSGRLSNSCTSEVKQLTLIKCCGHFLLLSSHTYESPNSNVISQSLINVTLVPVKHKSGRPRTSYENGSVSTKRRRILAINCSFSKDAVLDASKARLKKSGNKQGRKIMDMIGSEDSCTEILRKLKAPESQKMSPSGHLH